MILDVEDDQQHSSNSIHTYLTNHIKESHESEENIYCCACRCNTMCTYHNHMLDECPVCGLTSSPSSLASTNLWRSTSGSHSIPSTRLMRSTSSRIVDHLYADIRSELSLDPATGMSRWELWYKPLLRSDEPSGSKSWVGCTTISVVEDSLLVWQQ
jgi:hypothetical protein